MSERGNAISEDEWGWGQHAWSSEGWEWGIWGREGACEIKLKCFLCIQQVCRLRECG